MSNQSARYENGMPLEFEWDISKAVVNLKNHRVGFDEACTIFDDPFAATFRDEEHLFGEVFLAPGSGPKGEA
jgi:uncharacterized DUF497 family protein